MNEIGFFVIIYRKVFKNVIIYRKVFKKTFYITFFSWNLFRFIQVCWPLLPRALHERRDIL